MSKELIERIRAKKRNATDEEDEAADRIEELEAELRTRDNAEATHRITLRGVQAETMRVQTQCDALQADNARLRGKLAYAELILKEA